jgi:undecaprenyl-diphosphatase
LLAHDNWRFGEIYDQVSAKCSYNGFMQRALSEFDIQLVAWVNNLPSGLRPLMEFASFIGQPVLVGTALGVAAIALWRGNYHLEAKGVGLGIIALLVSNVLKLLIHRTRPDTYVPRVFHSYSFPSGHASATMIGFGILGLLAAKHLPAPWSVLVPVGLGLLILLVGLSRVYLGAHYPTDVLGGWLFGLLVLALVTRVWRLI